MKCFHSACRPYCGALAGSNSPNSLAFDGNNRGRAKSARSRSKPSVLSNSVRPRTVRRRCADRPSVRSAAICLAKNIRQSGKFVRKQKKPLTIIGESMRGICRARLSRKTLSSLRAPPSSSTNQCLSRLMIEAHRTILPEAGHSVGTIGQQGHA